jgi:hypothetical protein
VSLLPCLSQPHAFLAHPKLRELIKFVPFAEFSPFCKGH